MVEQGHIWAPILFLSTMGWLCPVFPFVLTPSLLLCPIWPRSHITCHPEYHFPGAPGPHLPLAPLGPQAGRYSRDANLKQVVLDELLAQHNDAELDTELHQAAPRGALWDRQQVHQTPPHPSWTSGEVTLAPGKGNSALVLWAECVPHKDTSPS